MKYLDNAGETNIFLLCEPAAAFTLCAGNGLPITILIDSGGHQSRPVKKLSRAIYKVSAGVGGTAQSIVSSGARINYYAAGIQSKLTDARALVAQCELAVASLGGYYEDVREAEFALGDAVAGRRKAKCKSDYLLSLEAQADAAHQSVSKLYFDIAKAAKGAETSAPLDTARSEQSAGGSANE